MVDIPSFNYASWTLAEKHAWLTGGQGARAAANDPAGRMRALAERMAQSSDSLRKALGGTGVEWRGQAATAVSASMRRSADWATAAGQSTGQGGGRVDGYGQSFSSLASKIPAPSVTGSFWDYAQAVLALPDYQDRLAQDAKADQAANDALKAHETETRSAVTDFPASTAAQPMTRGGGATGSVAGRAGGVGIPGGGAGGGAGSGAAASGPGGAGSAGAGAGSGSGGTGGGAAGGAGSGKAGSAGGLGPHAGAPAATTPSSWAPPSPVGTGAGGEGTSDWKPLTPTSGTSGSGMAPSPGGGYVPAPAGGWSPSTGGSGAAWRPGLGGAGYAGGYRPELSARGGPSPDGAGSAPATGSSGAGGAGPVGRGSAPGGMSPMGGAGARGGQDKTHRNNVFIPSDEPFRVEFDDVLPSVIGMPDREDW